VNQVLLRQVLLVLAYSAQFNHPLKLAEIRSRLFVPKTKRNELADFWWIDEADQIKMIILALRQLEDWGFVANRGEWWTSVTNKNNLPHGVVGRKFANTKLAQAHRIALIFGWWPWIRDIYISGSVAAGASRIDDDLDFLIVTWPGSLWLTRPFVTLLAWILGHRRSWSKEEPNSWCFNIWLESDSLRFPGQAHSLYTAFELIQLKQVWGEQHSHLIWSENAWIYNRLPLFNHQLIHYDSPVRSLSQTPILMLGLCQLKTLLAIIGYPLVIMCNYVAYLVQLVYMRPHQTREKVGLKFALFHPRDTRRQIYDDWQREVITVLEFLERKKNYER